MGLERVILYGVVAVKKGLSKLFFLFCQIGLSQQLELLINRSDFRDLTEA